MTKGKGWNGNKPDGNKELKLFITTDQFNIFKLFLKGWL